MGFRKKVLEVLESLEYKINQLNSRVEDKSQEIKRLEAQNKALFDRLMSIKWEDYINMNPDRWDDKEKTEVVISPSANEDNIGEVLSDEDLGK